MQKIKKGDLERDQNRFEACCKATQNGNTEKCLQPEGKAQEEDR